MITSFVVKRQRGPGRRRLSRISITGLLVAMAGGGAARTLNATISMNVIRRAGVFIAAAVTLPFIILAASGCGSAGTATGGTANGLEHETATQVLHDAAHALAAAKSVHIVWTMSDGKAGPSKLDVQVQGGSKIITVVDRGTLKTRFVIIGQYAYVKLNPAALKMLGGLPLARSAFGHWLKIPAKQLSHGGPAGFSLASLATVMTRSGPLDPAVRQATLNGRNVVVITDHRHGVKLYIANTGPAYPLRADLAGPHPQRIDFTSYGVNFHITAPANAISAR